MHTAQLELLPGAASVATIHRAVMCFAVNTPMLIKAVQVSELHAVGNVTKHAALKVALKGNLWCQ